MKDILKQLDKIKETDMHAKEWMQKDLANLKAHMKTNPVSSTPSKPPAHGLSLIAIAGVVLIAALGLLAIFIGGDIDSTETATPSTSTSTGPTNATEPTQSVSPTTTPTDDQVNTTATTPNDTVAPTPTPENTQDPFIQEPSQSPSPDGTDAPLQSSSPNASPGNN